MRKKTLLILVANLILFNICILGQNKISTKQDFTFIACYPFDGNANDESGNGFHGIVNGATLTEDRNGNLNSAYYFSGSSTYISVPDNDLLDLQNVKSISLWIKASSSSSINRYIISKVQFENDYYNGYEIYISNNDSLSYSMIEEDYPRAHYSKSFQYYDEWTFLTFVRRSDNKLYCYINGNYVGKSEVDLPVSLTGNDMDLFFGSAPFSNNNDNYQGSIDDIAIFDYELSDAEIQELYNDDPPLPIELVSFSAVIDGKKVYINWKTVTELQNFGFEIQKKVGQSGYDFFEKIGFIIGAGNSSSPKEYSFIDDLSDMNLYRNNIFYYRLKQIDMDGAFEFSDEIFIELNPLNTLIPENNSLSNNYPNPFNPSTTIRFGLPEKSNVKLTIYNSLGEEVSSLLDKELIEGYHEVEFNALDLASGVYFYSIQAGEFKSVKKMLLLK